jgi:actin-related protein
LHQGGIAEAIAESISATHSDLHEALFANILVIGATARLNGLRDRLESEIKQLAPSCFDVNVSVSSSYALICSILLFANTSQ